MMDYVFIMIAPVLIVVIWNRRPVLTIVLATIIAYASAAGPELLEIFQKAVDFKIGDPKSVLRDVSASFVDSAIRLPFVVPILAVVGWVTKRKDR